MLHSLWSYLCGRSQCVLSKTLPSSYRDINLGVLQGSVLVQRLFFLYINDLGEYLVENGSLRLLYADNLQINFQTPDQQMEEELQ